MNYWDDCGRIDCDKCIMREMCSIRKELQSIPDWKAGEQTKGMDKK